MKFRKKPVIIDAIQYTGDNAISLNKWSGGVVLESLIDGKSVMLVPTNHGTAIAKLTDWVIRNAFGEYYPCDAETFANNYEPVND